MPKKVTIKVSIFVETRLEMDVSWNEDDEHVEIHRVDRLMIQPTIDTNRIGEHLSEDDYGYIEEEALKALGIERD